MRVAVLNSATVNDDMEALTSNLANIHSRSEPTNNMVCAEADLIQNLANIQENMASELDVELIWSDSETTDGVYEGRDSDGELLAVITVWVVEV